MKKTIRDYDLSGKKVLIRVDFNVPIQNGVITDDNRIVQSLDTIRYAIEHDAKVILLSHLGRVKTVEDLEKNSLEVVATRLSELLRKEVLFLSETRGKALEHAVDNMEKGDVILIQNTRYEDLSGKKESSNDVELASYWAHLGDIYINDAFGTSHRAHASNVGIASILPNGIGFLIERELSYLLSAIEEPKKPFVVILGGSKVHDKIGVIENVVKKADYLLIGGGMAFTFLKAEGIEVGNSLLDLDSLDFCKRMLQEYPDKIILPTDVICSTSVDSKEFHECFITDLKADWMGLDIGSGTLKLFRQYLENSKTVIWNGPVGMFEKEAYSFGTKGLCDILSHVDATVILGGGDTASAAIQFGYQDKFSHISTGGGATLELLEGKELPGLAVIHEK